MSTRERALSRFNMLSEKGLDEFIAWFDTTFSSADPDASSKLTDNEQVFYDKLSSALSGFGEDFLPDGRPEFVPSKRNEL